MQNFSSTSQNLRVTAVVRFVHCPNPSDCWETTTSYSNTHNSVASQDIRSSAFSIPLTQITSNGEWYEVDLSIAPAAGGGDDFSNNDLRIFKFRVNLRFYLPLIIFTMK